MLHIIVFLSKKYVQKIQINYREMFSTAEQFGAVSTWAQNLCNTRLHSWSWLKIDSNYVRSWLLTQNVISCKHFRLGWEMCLKLSKNYYENFSIFSLKLTCSWCVCCTTLQYCCSFIIHNEERKCWHCHWHTLTSWPQMSTENTDLTYLHSWPHILLFLAHREITY